VFGEVAIDRGLEVDADHLEALSVEAAAMEAGEDGGVPDVTISFSRTLSGSAAGALTPLDTVGTGRCQERSF
jgi:hypothetical protein